MDNSLDNPVDKRLKTQAGYVLPKRMARRAATRNLIRRQMRQVLAEQRALPEPGLPEGIWVLRLRQGFAVADFPSASSVALKRVARAELQGLVAKAALRAHERVLERAHQRVHEHANPRTPSAV